MRTTKILLADDHTLIRECLIALLEKSPGLEVVAQAASGMEAVRLAYELQPDLVLMDLVMPDGNGIEASRCILSAFPDMKVLMLSMYGDARSVRQALDAGARGFLVKCCPADEIVNAISIVSDNGFYLSSHLQGVLEHELESAAGRLPLTSREEEVLVLMAEGKTSREIAAQLQISPKTVETHRMHLMKKLNLTSIASLTKYALREGLLLLD
ncbi:response regulator [Geomonas subterranea]|uniref:Response regulator transcription factor n=1 Tax=Geomonas subterranea TaxID=2847989 RepID=A0ABX8LMN0_9BACT|nr:MULTISPECIES: response regulator transcription factor [Geomonas]QXE92938.1 response regulator transcription factor [Geomonas subterranea]QXM08956.1 response regulator transcription factor [Geomonas subterranea]